MTDNSSMAVTAQKQPAFADMEKRMGELLTQAGLHSRNSTCAASPYSSPTRVLPTPEPHRVPPQPQHSYDPMFEQYALYGLAGQAVRTLAPHTEAQPEAILLQLLAAFGNVIGPGPHCIVGATRHTLNLFVVLVGEF